MTSGLAFMKESAGGEGATLANRSPPVNTNANRFHLYFVFCSVASSRDGNPQTAGRLRPESGPGRRPAGAVVAVEVHSSRRRRAVSLSPDLVVSAQAGTRGRHTNVWRCVTGDAKSRCANDRDDRDPPRPLLF